MLNEAESLLTPEPSVLLPGVRWGRQARTWEYADLLSKSLLAPEQEFPSLVRRKERVAKDQAQRNGMWRAVVNGA
jgi:hypothetical protein